MEKLILYLFKPEEATFVQKVKNLFAMILLNLIWVVFVIQMYQYLIPRGLPGMPDPRNDFQVFFWACLIAPFWEELVFRYLPRKIGDVAPKLMVPMIIVSSILFGLIHSGVPSILIQGVIGFSFFWLYMKNGSIVWTMLAHALWNLIVIFGLSYL